MTTNQANSDIDDSEVTPSSGNVFADLSFENPEEMLLKAELVRQISAAIKERGLDRYQAAEVLGIDQPKISALLKGRFSSYSLECLFKYLNALGRDLEIVVKSSPNLGEKPSIKVTAVHSS
jgi:predicted XRE-type DNA-binding protein